MVRIGRLCLCWMLHPFLGFVTYALPSTSALLPRDSASGIDDDAKVDATPLNSTEKSLPLVNASAQIKDSNGVDITSSFQIKVYHPNATTHISYQNTTTHVTNLTEQGDFHDRRGLEMGNAVRIMNDCPGGETFVESHCIPSEDTVAPLQGYSYMCKKTVEHWHALTGEYMGWRPAVRSRRGRCEPTELCVDGFGSQPIASCVHHVLFDDYTTDKKGQLKGMLNGEVFNVAKMYAVMAKSDANVAIKAKKLGIKAWDSSAASAGESAQSKNCVNCVDLETDLLEPGIDSLKIEATLMSTGAVAGALYLALG